MVKKWPFFHFFSLGNISQENVFCDILERKNAFLANRKKTSKSRKIEIFPKGLTHGFGQKMAIFPSLFFFCNIGRENVFYNILEQKNAFPAYKNNRFKKSKIWNFSKGVNLWFWWNNGHFSMSFFFCNIGQENVFYNVLEQKHAFLAFKNNTFKKPKNWDFSKGVNLWFWSKNGHFSISFL